MSKDNSRNRLLADYPADQIGMWQVRGEDPNCDLGGTHHMPDLGLYEGQYIDIVELALNMPRFFSWGGGGEIREVKSKKIGPNTVRQMKETKAELRDVNKRKEELEKRLDWLKLGGTT